MLAFFIFYDRKNSKVLTWRPILLIIFIYIAFMVTKLKFGFQPAFNFEFVLIINNVALLFAYYNFKAIFLRSGSEGSIKIFINHSKPSYARENDYSFLKVDHRINDLIYNNLIHSIEGELFITKRGERFLYIYKFFVKILRLKVIR
tara:strand:+ start:188 stop:625 length:438 start_codon:yes stop_codon:yes gene_type:complete